MSAQVDPRPMESVADGPVEAACPCCDGRQLSATYTVTASQGVVRWGITSGALDELERDGIETLYIIHGADFYACDACDREWRAEQLTLYRDGHVVRRGDAGPAVTDHPHPRHGGLAP